MKVFHALLLALSLLALGPAKHRPRVSAPPPPESPPLAMPGRVADGFCVLPDAGPVAAAPGLGAPVPPGYEYWCTVRAKVTAYDPSAISCGDSADGLTSIGDNAWVLDGVAVDPSAIPYRTRMFIPGIGLREADDTGSAMRRSWRDGRVFHVDVRMSYPWQARRWGVRMLDIPLYRPIRSLAARTDGRSAAD
jgi:3D (Asp-Asp-Asp) domain-containing protein